jgi:hypothetical protein
MKAAMENLGKDVLYKLGMLDTFDQVHEYPAEGNAHPRVVLF